MKSYLLLPPEGLPDLFGVKIKLCEFHEKEKTKKKKRKERKLGKMQLPIFPRSDRAVESFLAAGEISAQEERNYIAETVTNEAKLAS